jgi:hypothetical protein
VKVTADGCERKRFAAGQEMEKGFLLNGVNVR